MQSCVAKLVEALIIPMKHLLPNYGYNYYIEAERKGTSNSIIFKLVMNNDQSWTSIQLSYLVSGRSDMSIGNFETPIN